MHAISKQHCNRILTPLSKIKKLCDTLLSNKHLTNTSNFTHLNNTYIQYAYSFFRMPFYLQSSKFRSRVIPFLEKVEKDISIWLNSPLQFKIVASYLDIIGILDVTGDQNTITLPLNIAKKQYPCHVTCILP